MGQHTDAVNAWEKATAEARDAAYAARSKAREDYDAKRVELRYAGIYTVATMEGVVEARETAFIAADAAMADAIDSAWKALGAAVAGDPLAEWIVNNCRDRSFEAAGVLRLLPATLAELDAYAESEEWCHEWNEYRQRAIGAGVLTETPITAARRAVHDFVNGLCCPVGRSLAADLDALLDAMINASNSPAEQVDA